MARTLFVHVEALLYEVQAAVAGPPEFKRPSCRVKLCKPFVFGLELFPEHCDVKTEDSGLRSNSNLKGRTQRFDSAFFAQPRSGLQPIKNTNQATCFVSVSKASVLFRFKAEFASLPRLLCSAPSRLPVRKKRSAIAYSFFVKVLRSTTSPLQSACWRSSQSGRIKITTRMGAEHCISEDLWLAHLDFE